MVVAPLAGAMCPHPIRLPVAFASRVLRRQAREKKEQGDCVPLHPLLKSYIGFSSEAL